MQGFSLATDLTSNPLTSIVVPTPELSRSSPLSAAGAAAPDCPRRFTNRPMVRAAFCDAGSDYWPQGRLESWITHVRPLSSPAFSVTEIDFLSAQLSFSELKKLEQQCYAIEANPSNGGVGSGHGVCTCDPTKELV